MVAAERLLVLHTSAIGGGGGGDASVLTPPLALYAHGHDHHLCVRLYPLGCVSVCSFCCVCLFNLLLAANAACLAGCLAVYLMLFLVVDCPSEFIYIYI